MSSSRESEWGLFIAKFGVFVNIHLTLLFENPRRVLGNLAAFWPGREKHD
jgi:hypothetical protein